MRLTVIVVRSIAICTTVTKFHLEVSINSVKDIFFQPIRHMQIASQVPKDPEVGHGAGSRMSLDHTSHVGHFIPSGVGFMLL